MILRVLSGAMLALSVTCIGAQAQPSAWSEYRNQKYGLSVRYPGDLFVVERTAEAGDGQVFVTHEGDARLLVGALVNDSGFTAATYQAHIARQSYGNYKVTYKPIGRTWFVLSGEGDGKVFYEKVMLSCSGRLIKSFAIIYPANKQHVFNPSGPIPQPIANRRAVRARRATSLWYYSARAHPYDREYLRDSYRVPDRSHAKVLACSFALT
jgi:hypothetical protein